MHVAIWRVRPMIKVTSISLDEDIAKALEGISTRLGISKSMAVTVLIMREAEIPITENDRRRLLGPVIDARAKRKIERGNKQAKKEYNNSINKDSDIDTNDDTELAEPIDTPAPATPSRIIQKLNVMDDKDEIERDDDGMI